MDNKVGHVYNTQQTESYMQNSSLAIRMAKPVDVRLQIFSQWHKYTHRNKSSLYEKYYADIVQLLISLLNSNALSYSRI